MTRGVEVAAPEAAPHRSDRGADDRLVTCSEVRTPPPRLPSPRDAARLAMVVVFPTRAVLAQGHQSHPRGVGPYISGVDSPDEETQQTTVTKAHIRRSLAGLSAAAPARFLALEAPPRSAASVSCPQPPSAAISSATERGRHIGGRFAHSGRRARDDGEGRHGQQTRFARPPLPPLPRPR